jgi:probable HAF family extracellular repeat protein
VCPKNNHFVSEALGINDSGQIVGWGDMDSGQHAFICNAGTMQDLNSLIPSGWTLNEATGINASGQICGYGTNPSGQTDAILLTPTLEPSTFVLLGMGAVALTAYTWRRRLM